LPRRPTRSRPTPRFAADASEFGRFFKAMVEEAFGIDLASRCRR
jgi:hypothetical protein